MLERSRKLMMSIAGAPLSQDITICHHLETTQDDEFTESERGRDRELVKQTLFDLFRMSKPGETSLTPIEDTEVRIPLTWLLLQWQSKDHVDKASILMTWPTVSIFDFLKALSVTKRYPKAVISQPLVVI